MIRPAGAGSSTSPPTRRAPRPRAGRALHGDEGRRARSRGICQGVRAAPDPRQHVAPGPADWTQRRDPEPEAREQLRREIPWPLAEPEDISAVVLFLASEGARHITGATIDVNGGYVMVSAMNTSARGAIVLQLTMGRTTVATHAAGRCDHGEAGAIARRRRERPHAHHAAFRSRSTARSSRRSEVSVSAPRPRRRPTAPAQIRFCDTP